MRTQSPSVQSSLRRTLLAFVSVAAVSAVLVSSADAAPTTPVISITTDASCSQPSTCTDYDISIKNPGTLPMNGMTISIVPLAPITGFMLAGQPASKQTGVQDAWAISPLNIAGGATDKGTFQVATPLTATDSISVYTTEDGFLSSVGLDLHVQAPSKPSKPSQPPGTVYLDIAADFVKNALADEGKALAAKQAAAMSKDTRIGVNGLTEAKFALRKADEAGRIDANLEATIDTDLTAAISDDEKAEHAEQSGDEAAARRLLKAARANKETALRLLELALK